MANAVQVWSANGVTYERMRIGTKVVMRGTDGSFASSNFDHYLEVKKARRDQGVPSRILDNKVDHAYTGKSVIDQTTGAVYEVEKVYQDWWHGRFLAVLLVRNGSHRTCIIENLSSQDENIIRQAAEFQSTFRLQE